MSVDGIVLGNIGLPQDAIAIALSLTTISSLLDIPNMEDKRQVESECQLDLGLEGKGLELPVSKAPAYTFIKYHGS